MPVVRPDRARLPDLSLRYGFGLGFWPTAIALVLLAIPPIFTNAFTGMRDVDPGMVEAARGMGMHAREVVWGVEIPAALPLILTGMRVSAVQVVATATLGAYVGYGGLGAFIVEGFATQDDGKLLTGAVLVALMAIMVELVFGAAQKQLTPWTQVGLLAKRDAMVDATVMEAEPATALRSQGANNKRSAMTRKIRGCGPCWPSWPFWPLRAGTIRAMTTPASRRRRPSRPTAAARSLRTPGDGPAITIGAQDFGESAILARSTGRP